MNEADPELRRMPPGGMTQIVAELILLLIAQHRKRRDSRGKLIVPESLESRNRLEGRAEGKRQGKSQVLVPRCGVMQGACSEGKRTQPIGAECELIPRHQVQIVRSRSRSRRRQRCLLYQVVVGRVVVDGRAREPLRALRLRPVET